MGVSCIETLACSVQKREAKACLEAAGKMLKVHAAGRIPLNRKEDEIYKVCLPPGAPPSFTMTVQQMDTCLSRLAQKEGPLDLASCSHPEDMCMYHRHHTHVHQRAAVPRSAFAQRV